MPKKSFIAEYEQKIKEIESFLGMVKRESCTIIITHLEIYGRMTHHDLLKRTNLSRGTIFRSLTLLQEAGIVAKGEDPEIEDKRMNTYYYLKKATMEYPQFEQEFLDYLAETKRSTLYEDGLLSWSIYPSAMLKETARIRTKKILEKHDKGKPPSEGFCVSFQIASIADSTTIFEKILACIEEVNKHCSIGDRKTPLEHPKVFSLVYVPLD
ncbi:MAG: hypothetical protein ACE5OZ_01790 [Candidatus Heimdallarchaeota archaeon]